MHDPSTVAFEIRSPIRRKSDFFKNGYRAPLVTIWHEDPLDFEGKRGCRSDDSCGWFRPPYTEEQEERIKKLGRQQYSTIWGKQHAAREGKDYAYVCYEPSCYDAIYWTWRAINHSEKRQGAWQYGVRLTARELQEIFELSSNPVDNLRVSLWSVKDEDTAADWFMLVYRCWQRFNRPWYRHPRWHFWHWRLQVHPLQKLMRRLLTRCEACGRLFGWSESPVGLMSGDAVWHSRCFPSPSTRPPAVQPSEARAATPDPASDTRH